MEKAILVSIELRNDPDAWRIEDLSAELEELSASTSVEVLENVICLCDRVTPNYFIGTGKVEEIAFILKERQADLVIFSHNLSGTQQRNLEQALGSKVIDRTQLILDIFSQRARSPEGKMQVELAQLEYLLPRLSGKGVMLSDLGGGIGTRGPGETKLELDRRQVRKKIAKLKEDLRKAGAHRQAIRKKRKSAKLPCVALVGYTSAGKSTLLNLLTASAQATSEKLFTTLDPLTRNLTLPNGQAIVISDTVGFLHALPHHLIEAFKATLEEVRDADLLIHVLDVDDYRLSQHNQAVQEVLADLGVQEKPVLVVLNKIDLVTDQQLLESYRRDFPGAVAISAKTGQQIERLLAILEEHFSALMLDLRLTLPHSRMDLVNFFYQHAKIKQIDYLPKGINLSVQVSRPIFDRVKNDPELKKSTGSKKR